MAEPQEVFQPPELVPPTPSEMPGLLQRSNLLSVNHAKVNIFNAQDDDPEEAAKSISLSEDTGVPAPIIHGDQENFERQYKTTLSSNLIEANPHLADYINSHPLAASISHDDLGQLDAVTQKLRQGGFITPSITDQAVQGFLRGWHREETFGTPAMQLPGAMELADQYGVAGRLGLSIANLIGIPLEIMGRATSGSLEAIHAGLKETYRQFGGSEQGAEQFSRDIAGLVEERILRGELPLHVRPEAVDTIQANKLMEYIKAGKEPPAGISPVYDELKVMEAEKDLKGYDEVMKEAQASSTKQRSPELFANFIRTHTDTEIAISAKRLGELYGERTPTPDDNLLGWVPDIAERLELEKASDGYIEIPLADWVAKVDPKVADELHDFIRVRRNGLSTREIELVKEAGDIANKPPPDRPPPVLETGDAPVNALRAQAHAEPMFDPERFDKLKLKREDIPLEDIEAIGGHSFDIVDAHDKPVGRMVVNPEEGGKHLEVAWIGSAPSALEARPNTFGPRVIRDLLAQLRREFPDAETIGGRRISGARHGPAGTGLLEAKIPLNAPSPEAVEQLGFHLKVLSSPRTTVPIEADFTPGRTVTDFGITHPILASFKARDGLGTVKPDQFIGSLPKALYQFFGERIKEMAGDVDVYVVSGDSWRRYEEKAGRGSGGYYYSDTHRILLPPWSVDGTSGLYYTPAILFHEAAHAATVRALRTDDLFRAQAVALMNEADAWMTEHLPEQRKYHDYAFSSPKDAAEFFAEAWSKQDFQQTLSHVPISKELAEHLGLGPEIKTAWDAVRKIISDIIERIVGKRPSPSILDGLLHMGNRLDELHEMHPELRDPTNAWKGLPSQIDALPDYGPEKPVAERPVIKTPGTFGLTAEQYRRYGQLINKRMKEEHAAELAKIEKDETKRQSKEWKANATAMRQEVEQDMYNRPDIAANEWFRTGTLFGQKGKTPRIDPSFLTPEQKAGLPPDYIRRGGVNPDDVAGDFGYQSGKAMIDRMVILNNAQKQLGKYGKNFINHLVDTETERRMEERYGDLASNILQETKDRVMNETQLDIIHEDILALAAKAKAELPFKRADVKQWVKDEFLKIKMGAIDSDTFITDAGKAGTRAEIHLLRNEFGDAFREKQAQYIAALKAQEAVKVEKLLTQFQRNAKRYSAREVASTDQSYTNWIHDILMRTGNEVKRSQPDLANSISKQPFKNLNDFVGDKEAMLREVAVADFLLDPNWKKEFNSMTVDEFKAVHDSIKSLIKNGIDTKKIIKAGEAAELDEVLAGMYDQLKAFGSKHYDAAGKRWLGPIPPAPAKALRTYFAAHLQIESLTNRWDHGDPMGLFTQYISRDLAEASAQEAIMEKAFSQKLRAIADKVDLNQKIDNDVFMDPFSIERGEPTPLPMTRKNLRAVMQHLGNESNFDKLAKGYLFDKDMAPGDNIVAMFKARIMDWVNKNATKEDWDWASKQGKIFAELKEESDAMYRRISGIEPESLELRPVQTPFGTYDGWYHPLDNHPLYKGASKSLMGPEPLEEGGYYRATTGNRYTKKRTGAVYPVALDLDMTPVRMKQMIHDISFREAIINSAKVIYDKRFLNAVSDFYGKEYADLFVPWLRDVAGSANSFSAAQGVAAKALEFFRQNIIASFIGFNPGTVMKHMPTAAMNSLTEIGGAEYLAAVKSLFSINERTGQSNWNFAMDKFAELQRRTRHYQETMGGAQERVMGELGPIEAVKAGQLPSFMSLREGLIKTGAAPVAFSDLLSAVPMGLAAYTKAIREGMTEGDAVYMANRAIRRAHGSTAVTSRPAIARGGPLASYLSSLYGFFSHIMNRQFELGWRAREAAGLVKEGEYTEAMSRVPQLSKMLFSYVIFPAIVEEMVSPLTNEDRQSWGVKAAKALTFGLSSSWIGVRDFTHAMMHMRDPQAGLLDATLKTGIDVARDLSKGRQAFDKKHLGTTIQHTTTLLGAATGLTNAPEGRVAKFTHDYSVGIERPKGWSDWYKGLRFGTTKEQR